MIAGEISFENQLMSLENFKECCSTLSYGKNVQIEKGDFYRIGSDKEITSCMLCDKRVSVILDGNVFNKDELKYLCRQKGIMVESNTPSELILKMYLAYHEECVGKMNGTFAFAIIDERNDSVFLARDPMGIKPLFYSVLKDSFLFASEIKGILKHPDIHARAGSEELMEMILLGPARTPGKTYFKDIEEVKPGHSLTITRNGIQDMRYYFLKDDPWTKSEQETIELIHDLVSDAIVSQCPDDVKPCAMLSGGLDSSIVVSVLSKKISDLNTYSVDYEDQNLHFKPSFYQPNRDQDYIDLMVKQCHLDSNEIVLNSKNLKDSLISAMKARDMPSMADVDSSLLCFLRQIFENDEKVVFSGECSDEIFGGYPWYTQPHLRSVNHFPWSNNIHERISYLKEEFIKENPDVFIRKRILSSLNELHFHYELSEEEKKMKQLMKLNLDYFMQTLTDRADRMSRSSGLSVCVPFCDLRIVEALYRIPWSMKFQENTEKYLLRKAFERELPLEICTRKKSPYPKTHHPEYEALIQDELTQIISDSSSPLLQIIRKDKLIELMKSESSVPWYGQLMTKVQTMAYFVQMNEWLKEYDVEIIHPKG